MDSRAQEKLMKLNSQIPPNVFNIIKKIHEETKKVRQNKGLKYI